MEATHVEMCSLLIKKGADVNFLSRDNTTALYYAVLFGIMRMFYLCLFFV